MRTFFKVMLTTASLLAPSALALGSGVASAAITIAYVSPRGSPARPDNSCKTAGFSSINKAIGAVSVGGTVVVCRGTYRTQVVVRKPLSLEGQRGAVINAKGQKPVPGLPVPGGSGVAVLATRHVLVAGFTVVNAGFDAILVARSTRIRVSSNVLMHNGDVGVDFNGSSFSVADHNTARYNAGGGFLVTDAMGRSSFDAFTSNEASLNPGGSGVIVAGHSTAGLTHNLIEDNFLVFNGRSRRSPGAGVVIATEVRHETVADNTVADNTIFLNGLAGVIIHSHANGQHMNGNRVIGNTIGTNNTVGNPIGLGASATGRPDRRTTGIMIGASSRIKVLISGNDIYKNFYGIFIEGRVRAVLRRNHFHRVVVRVRFA
jgi:nitrous oxidase accessory protein NosD